MDPVHKTPSVNRAQLVTSFDSLNHMMRVTVAERQATAEPSGQSAAVIAFPPFSISGDQRSVPVQWSNWPYIFASEKVN